MRKYILIGLFIGITLQTFADEWIKPIIKSYFSENGNYMIKVFPTEYPEKYGDWLNSKPDKKKRFSVEDTTVTLCHAILYQIEKADTIEIWNKKLINKLAPMMIIISNDGKSFVTFDNWCSLGYGSDVMVVYDERGEVIKKYKLEDFSPFPINKYKMTILSIWWRCNAKYINNQTIEICFKDEKENIKSRIYHILTNKFE
jgi:hypothetical protein